MDWYQSLCSVTDAYGISMAEFLVLDLVRMKVPLAPSEMARFAVTSYSHRPEVKCGRPSYEAAVENCLDNRQLRVLSKPDLRTPLPSWSAFARDSTPPPHGVLDFTERGYHLAHRAAADMAKRISR